MIDYSLSDSDILVRLADKIRKKRLVMNMTQKEAAKLAGVHYNTISKFEQGNDITLMSLIQILRAIDELDSLNSLLAESTESPVDLFRKRGKERQRASGSAGTGNSDEIESEW